MMINYCKRKITSNTLYLFVVNFQGSDPVHNPVTS